MELVCSEEEEKEDGEEEEGDRQTLECRLGLVMSTGRPRSRVDGHMNHTTPFLSLVLVHFADYSPIGWRVEEKSVLNGWWFLNCVDVFFVDFCGSHSRF